MFFLKGTEERISERGTEAEIVTLIFSLLSTPSHTYYAKKNSPGSSSAFYMTSFPNNQGSIWQQEFWSNQHSTNLAKFSGRYLLAKQLYNKQIPQHTTNMQIAKS